MVFWALSIFLGLAQAWESRMDIVNDTISYLDMGNYFFHGHPAALINGIWSPLDAFLLGATLRILKPSLQMEYPAVHLLTFLIFLFTLVCFDFFLCQLSRLAPDSSSGLRSDWPWISIAYAIFLCSSLLWISVYQTNPDMLVAAFFFVSCGLLIRISVGLASWKPFLVLGVTLGLSYLTKGVMFPLSLVLLATAWLVAKKKPSYILISVTAFLLISVPYIVVLSMQKGHLTVGETGIYNYVVHINGIPRHHWQGGPDGAGVPAHPTRQVFSSPAAFEFNGPLPGTYPVWYDPTFWYEGVKPQVHVREQIHAVVRNLAGEFETVFYALNGVIFTTLFVVLYEARNKPRVLENLYRCWFLIVPCVLGLGLYALVHFEARYGAAFLAVLGVCLFSSVLCAEDFPKRRLFSGVAIVQLGVLLWLIAPPLLFHLRHPWTSDKGSYQAVAESALEMGLRPGDQVASLEFSSLTTALWAHLARIQIIAEVYYWPGGPEGDRSGFWDADLTTQTELLERLRQSGAKAVISSESPRGPGAARWSRIGNTDYYLLWLNPPTLALQGG